MMDGVQLRWLRTPGQDLNAMWAECEDALFPLPMWEGYRSPKPEYCTTSAARRVCFLAHWTKSTIPKPKTF